MTVIGVAREIGMPSRKRRPFRRPSNMFENSPTASTRSQSMPPAALVQASAAARVAARISTPFTPRPADAADGTWRMSQREVDRVQEFRKCIECFLCQDVCHILRDHGEFEGFSGPRFVLYSAALEMHPLDTADRSGDLKDKPGIGFCNITRCCTKVCPEHITITENAIIPLKERVVARFYDPLTRLLRVFRN